MNWSQILNFSIFLLVLFCIVTSVLYYVRHYYRRKGQKKDIRGALSNEGEFLKRYIPERLRTSGDLEQTAHNPKSPFGKFVYYTVLIALLSGSVFLIRAFVYKHHDLFLADIDLTDIEVSKLIKTPLRWKNEYFPPSEIEQYLQRIEQKGVVLIGTAYKSKKAETQDKLVTDAQERYINYLNSNNIKFKFCVWENMELCQLTPKEKSGIIIGLPGKWEQKTFDDLLTAGASILLHGLPLHLADDTIDFFRLYDLQFENYIYTVERYLSVVGDQVLTLGIDAGTYLKIPPFYKSLRVQSDNAQAMTIGVYPMAGTSADTRLYAKPIKAGRLVWSDFLPFQVKATKEDVSEDYTKIYKNIYRYLLKDTYSHVATWPKDYKFAVTLSQDSEDKFEYTEDVLDILEDNSFPVTWFMISDLAKINRDLTVEMSKVGEVACHGDSHNKFIEDDISGQVMRIARCKKVLKELTKQEAGGFRPPFELFNLDTISSTANNGMYYFFGKSGTKKMVPSVMSSKSGKYLVSINRSVSDDFLLWSKKKYNEMDSKRIVESEMNWIKAIGGSYSFSFHSQYMSESKNLRVVEKIIQLAKTQNSFNTTVGNLANWWFVREKIKAKGNLTNEERTKFKPHNIKVNSAGNIERVAL